MPIINKNNHFKSILKNKAFSKNEEGFTLVELMIVIVIIGILAAVAIPIFANQQKSAIEATIKNDMKNAATVIQTEATKNAGKYASWIPSYSAQSADNQVILDQAKSNKQMYCLTGKNPAVAGVTYYLSSADGKLSTSASACPDVSILGPNSVSFQAGRSVELTEKKALIVYHAAAFQKNAITGYGYGTVDTKNATDFLAMSDAEVNAYDLVFLEFYAWTPTAAVRDKAKLYYDQGGIILQDGNDSGSNANPWIASSQLMVTAGAYSPTYAQGLSPAFPYTFETEGWSGDNWACTKSLHPPAVSIATTQQGGLTCHTMFAATNGGGRWVFISQITSPNGPFVAAMDWLHA